MVHRSLRFTLVAVFAFVAVSLGAHPHMWTEAKTGFSIDEGANLVLELTWSFDLGFSELIMVDYDKNDDHALSKPEIDAIYKGAFINVATFNYFSKIYVNDKEFAIKKVTDFTASLGPKGELVYSFKINLNTTLNKLPLTIGVMQFDSTYFNDVTFAPAEGADFQSAEFTVQTKEVNVPKLAYWGGMIVPKKRIYTFAKK